MKKLKWLGLCVAVAFGMALSCGGSSTIKAPWSQNFDGNNVLKNWQYYNGAQLSNKNNTLWAVDETPSTAPGGAYKSGPKSLNYNNGKDYDTGPNSGTIITPNIQVKQMQAPVLSFWCNYQTEDQGIAFDKRFVKVGKIVNKQPQYLLETQLSTMVTPLAGGACAAMGTWHQHVINLLSSWDTIRIAFIFDTVGNQNNNFAGWFIDDFQIVEASSVNLGTGGLFGGPGTGLSQTIYSSTFDTPDMQKGWQLSAAVNSVGWAIDNSPAFVKGGAFYSSPSSLNYNNGTNYDSGGSPNSGTAASPEINLSGNINANFVFRCNYETESNGPSYDKRFVQISNNNFATLLYEQQLSTVGQPQAMSTNGSPQGTTQSCADIGTWHTHTIQLLPTWGTIRVRFLFNTYDASANNFGGWFIDDLWVGNGNYAFQNAGGNGVVAGADYRNSPLGTQSSKKKKGIAGLGGCSASTASGTKSGLGLWIVLIVLATGMFLTKRYAMKNLRFIGLGVLAAFATAATCLNQSVNAPWTTNFDGTNPLKNWVFANSLVAQPSTKNNTQWAVTGDAFKSAPNALTYKKQGSLTGSTNYGAAITPAVNISKLQSPVLVFDCYYQGDANFDQFDKRVVKVGKSSGPSTSAFVETQLGTSTSAVGGPCPSPGVWHQHVINLTPSWGTIRVGFIYDSMTSSANNFSVAGWSIDDLEIVDANPSTSGPSGGTVNPGTPGYGTPSSYGGNYSNTAVSASEPRSGSNVIGGSSKKKGAGGCSGSLSEDASQGLPLWLSILVLLAWRLRRKLTLTS